MRLLYGQALKGYEQLLFMSGQNAAKALVLQDTVKFLERFNDRLSAQLLQERTRANAAVDELLALRGLAPITPSIPSEEQIAPLFEEDPQEVARFHKQLEKSREGGQDA